MIMLGCVFIGISIKMLSYHLGIQIEGSRKDDTVIFLGDAPLNIASISSIL